MAQNNIDHMLSQYSSTILEAVKTLECKGRLEFYDRNLYTYIKTDNKFSYLTTEILAPSGFQLVPLMHKKFSPKSHISLMTNHEQDHIVHKKNVQCAYRKWRNVEIPFKIEMVEMTLLKIQPKIICSFKISSDKIESIRRDLGLEVTSDYYFMHITLCEKFL